MVKNMHLVVRYFPNLFLFINGLLYLILGYLFLTDAEGWFTKLEILPSEEVGFTELRAMYLGLMSAIGLFLIISSRSRGFLFPGLLFLLISYGFLAIVRGYGIFIQDASSQMMLDLLKAEVLSAILAVFALICCVKNSSIGN